MDATAEDLLLDEYYPAEAELLKETWPLPPENTVKEFEEFLMDIGLRF